MTVSFQLPNEIEAQLRADIADLDEVAKEAALVEIYRQGQLSHGKLAECLGISRYETDAVLKRHHVAEDLITCNDFDEQARALRKMLGE